MKTKLDDLFSPVDKSPVLVNKNVVDKYYAVTKHFEQSFLGIKRDNHLLIENETAYNNTLDIYHLLSQSKGKAFNWWINEANSQCAVIVSSQRLDQFASVYKYSIIDSLKKEYLQIDTCSLLEDSLKDTGINSGLIESQFNSFVSNKLSKLDLAIAFVNGYDIDYNCNYYLIIRWIDNDEKLKYLAISRTTPKHGHYKLADDFCKE